jgi:hypothetical protein
MRQFLMAVSLIACSSLPALAGVTVQRVTTETDFMVRSRVGFGENVYYNCDVVESNLESMLVKMGATNVHVECTGGIDDFRPPYAWESQVHMSFEAMKPAAEGATDMRGEYKAVDFKSWDNCYLYQQAFEEVKSGFDIKDAKVGSCSSSNSGFSLKANILN